MASIADDGPKSIVEKTLGGDRDFGTREINMKAPKMSMGADGQMHASANENEQEHSETRCHDNIDLVFWFDAKNHDLFWKQHAFSLLTDDTYWSESVQFSYFSKNQDQYFIDDNGDQQQYMIDDVYGYTSFFDGRQAAIEAIPHAVPAMTVDTPVLNSVAQAASGLFSYERGGRSMSTKILVAIATDWHETGIGSITEENFDEAFNELFLDHGVHPYFILHPASPDEANYERLVALNQLLDEHNVPCVWWNGRNDTSITNLDWVRDTRFDICTLKQHSMEHIGTKFMFEPTVDYIREQGDLEPLNSKYGWDCDNFGTRHLSPSGKEIWHEFLYSRRSSRFNRCVDDAEFELMIILDSSMTMGFTGYAQQKNFVRRMLMHLPYCSKYSIIRSSDYGVNGFWPLTHPNDADDNFGVVLREAISQFDMYQDFEETPTRNFVGPTREALKRVSRTTRTGEPLPFVVLYVTNGQPHDDPSEAMKLLLKTATVIVTGGVENEDARNQLGAMDNVDLSLMYNSPDDLWRNADVVANHIYCIAKRMPTNVIIPKKTTTKKLTTCPKAIDLFISIDPLTTEHTISTVIAMSSYVLDAFFLREDMTRIYLNNERVPGDFQSQVKNNLFDMIMGTTTSGNFVLPGVLHNRSDYLNANPGRHFKSLILLSSDATYLDNREAILQQAYYGRGDTTIWLTSDMKSYSIANTELQQEIFQSFIQITQAITNNGANIALAIPTVANIICNTVDTYTAPLPPCEACQDTVIEDKCDKPSDIAVLVDGSIPNNKKFIIPRFMRTLQQIFDFGATDDKSRLALYIAKGNVKTKTDRLYWEGDTARRGQVIYTEPFGFDFRRSFNPANINELMNDWAFMQEDSYKETVDINKALHDVIGNGFTSTKYSRTSRFAKQIIIVMWDYSTFLPKTLEYAVLQDIIVHFVFLKEGDTSLIKYDQKRFGWNNRLSGKLFPFGCDENSTPQYDSDGNVIECVENRWTILQILHDLKLTSLYLKRNRPISDILSTKVLAGIPEKVCQEVIPIVGCEIALDVGILLDGSASVSDIGFYKALNFVKLMIAGMQIDADHARVGIMQYAADFHTEAELAPRSMEDMLNIVKNIRYQNGKTTRTGQGINRLYDMLYENRRANTHAIAIVITDGKSIDNVSPAARKLKTMENLDVLAIGAVAYKPEELLEIASDISGDCLTADGGIKDTCSSVITVDDFDNLKTKLESLIGTLCAKQSAGEGENTETGTTYKESHSSGELLNYPEIQRPSDDEVKDVCTFMQTSGTFGIIIDPRETNILKKKDEYSLFSIFVGEILTSIRGNIKHSNLKFSVNDGLVLDTYAEVSKAISNTGRKSFGKHETIPIPDTVRPHTQGYLMFISEAMEEDSILSQEWYDFLVDNNLYGNTRIYLTDGNYAGTVRDNEYVGWYYNEYDIPNRSAAQLDIIENFLCNKCVHTAWDASTNTGCYPALTSKKSCQDNSCAPFMTPLSEVCGCPKVMCNCRSNSPHYHSKAHFTQVLRDMMNKRRG